MRRRSKLLIAVLMLVTGTASTATETETAVAPLSNGLDLQVIDHAVSCNGGPGAFVLRDGARIDQTCNVHITSAGVSVLFAKYGKRLFFPKEQFTVLPAK